MNNTEHGSKPIRNEVTGTPLHKNEVVSINNELNFELLSARQQLNRILTAANVSSVDEVVALLERKRDSQGFLINTDIDDTMSKPLSDEEIEQAFNNNFDCYADLEVSTEGIEGIEEMGLSIQAMTLSTFTRVVSELHANRQQSGWIDVKDVELGKQVIELLRELRGFAPDCIDKKIDDILLPPTQKQ